MHPEGPSAKRLAHPAVVATPVVQGQGERFPRSARLRRKSDIQLVLARGWRRRSTHVVVLLLPNALGVSRLGLAVSRKVGNAVARNRVKRRVRELFRRRVRTLIADGPGADVLVQALPGAASVPQSVIEEEIRSAVEAWIARGRPGGRPAPGSSTSRGGST